MKKVLVTGGAGFIGSHTVAELRQSGYWPVIVDDFSNSDTRVLEGLDKIIPGPLPVHRIDCTDLVALRETIRTEQPWAIIHFAAYKAVGESVAEPLKYYRNNLVSMMNVLDQMGESRIPRLVFSSSCTVYGQPEELPVTELSPLREPNSPYGFTKQVCEKMISDFINANRQFSAITLRYFNPVGAHPEGTIGELPFGQPNNLVPFLTQTVAGIHKELIVHGHDYSTPDGTCIRDYIHVVDLARAHVLALDWLDTHKGENGIFNLGQGRGHSVMEVIKTFEKVTGKKVPYRIGPRRSGDVEKIWADPSKANHELHWKTEFTLEDALRDAWRWQQNISDMVK